MVQTATAQTVMEIVLRSPGCDLEELVLECPGLMWNQVFLAVDHLSRSGEIMLMPGDRGTYTVTFPHRQDGRPERRSLPS
jgi:hypothetical protein